MDTFRCHTQSFLTHFEGRLRYIKDSDVLISSRQEVIYQCGFTAAYIDNRCRFSESALFYKAERLLKVRTIPTDCIRSFLRVDSFQ